jgi:hypothetical protein
MKSLSVALLTMAATVAALAVPAPGPAADAAPVKYDVSAPLEARGRGGGYNEPIDARGRGGGYNEPIDARGRGGGYNEPV